MKKDMKFVLSVMLMIGFIAIFSTDNALAHTTSKKTGVMDAKTTATKVAKKASVKKAATKTIKMAPVKKAATKTTKKVSVKKPTAKTSKKTPVKKAATKTTKKASVKKPTAKTTKRTSVKKPAIKAVKRTSIKRKRASRKISSRSASSRDLAAGSSVELLDWWTSASKVFARGATATIYDIRSGESFQVVRTMGTNHADVEARTAEDTAIIKRIWGGFSWDTRPIYVIVDGRRLAASMSAMPHAGLDSKPAYAQVDDRSGGFGSGMNLDVIKDNDMNGHMDIHFLNSTRHKDGKLDTRHQATVMEAAGR